MSVLGIALIPAISKLGEKKKLDDTTAAMQAASSGNAGEPWHPPALPVEQVTFRPSVPQPAPPKDLVVTTPNLLATVNPGGSGPADYRMFGTRQQPPPPSQQSAAPSSGVQATQVAATGTGGVGDLLKPSATEGFSAVRVQHPWATIEQGRIISCNLITPITSELPGFVKAKVLEDVRSMDGTTTLIDRNSTMFGEVSHGLAEGQERLFVLWRSILTPPPDNVRITINSPAADELGETGLPGDVNHHVWRRIGAAALLSGIETLGQGLSQYLGGLSSHGNSNNSSGSGLNFYSFQGQGSSLANSLLQHTVAIPDVLHRDHALSCSAFVSGDLDFSSVYSLLRRR